MIDRSYTVRYNTFMSNRERLLDEALEAFVARGYEGTGVQLLCERGEVTKPTLYYYFSNKAGVLESLLEREFGDLITRFRQSCAYTSDLTGTLYGVSRYFLESLSRRPRTGHLFLQLSFQAPESEAHSAFEKYRQHIHESLVMLFSRAEKDHGNFRGRSDQYAYLFAGFLQSTLGMVLAQGSMISESILKDLLHRFEHGIYS